MWKKTAESDELIVFEKQLKQHKLKIEARKNNSGWEVFKTKVRGNNADLISEHLLDNKNQVVKLIDRLKKEKKNIPIQKGIHISLKRVYKEEFIEKWFFKINNEEFKNFLLIKFDDDIKVDVVMHEKYTTSEKSIMEHVENNLGLEELGDSIQYDVFYYKQHKYESKKDYNINYLDIEVGFGDDSEEYY